MNDKEKYKEALEKIKQKTFTWKATDIILKEIVKVVDEVLEETKPQKRIVYDVMTHNVMFPKDPPKRFGRYDDFQKALDISRHMAKNNKYTNEKCWVEERVIWE